MQDIIKKDILSVLSDLAAILREKDESDAAEIRLLSNRVIHNASIFQDEDSISIAVLTYALSKIIEMKKMDIDYGRISGMIKSAIMFLKNDQEEPFRSSIKKMFDFIRALDKKIKKLNFSLSTKLNATHWLQQLP